MSEPSWFPPGVDTSSSAEKYLNIKKLPLGKEVRIRVLSQAISGKLQWGKPANAKASDNNKPYRVRPGVKMPAGVVWQVDERIGEVRGPIDFVAFAVWDYEAKRVRIVEVTQKPLLRALREHANSPDWGYPTLYDIGLTRTEDNGFVSYAMQPKPPKPLPADVETAWGALWEAGFDLEKLYDSGDPFPAGMGEAAETAEAAEEAEIPNDGAPPPTDNDLPF